MRFKVTRARLATIVVAILGVLLVGWWYIRPWWLTQTYGPELRWAILRYVKVLGTIEGRRDPSVMAQVATGESLKNLVQFRCKDCNTVLVTTKADVKISQVLEYSSVASEVIARIEVGWRPVSPDTGAVHGECHAQAYTNHLLLLRENGRWKVADLKDVNAGRVDDTPELLAKYCDSNRSPYVSPRFGICPRFVSSDSRRKTGENNQELGCAPPSHWG